MYTVPYYYPSKRDVAIKIGMLYRIIIVLVKQCYS